MFNISKYFKILHGFNKRHVYCYLSINIGQIFADTPARGNPFTNTDSGPRRSLKTTFDSSFLKSAISRALGSEFGSPMSASDLAKKVAEITDSGYTPETVEQDESVMIVEVKRFF